MAKDGTEQDQLLDLLSGQNRPTSEQFEKLVLSIDSHQILAKVFLLEGTPYVFSESPMKYVIFREQVAERFGVGSQDVCIVGSAKLGFSPSPHKYGTLFSDASDVDVVIISEQLFLEGSAALFAELNRSGPSIGHVRSVVHNGANGADLDLDWRELLKLKEAVRNFVFSNFNPGLLSGDHHLRQEFFQKIGTTAGLFLALEPKVFVSKIRGRVFRTWKAAEDYYSNSLRQLSYSLSGKADAEVDDIEIDDAEELPPATTSQAANGGSKTVVANDK